MPQDQQLIEAVVNSAKVPVIKHDAGICHVYVHAQADLAMAEQIVLNAKCQRPSACNALETLLVDRETGVVTSLMKFAPGARLPDLLDRLDVLARKAGHARRREHVVEQGERVFHDSSARHDDGSTKRSLYTLSAKAAGTTAAGATQVHSYFVARTRIATPRLML